MKTKMNAPSAFSFYFLLQFVFCFGPSNIRVYSADDFKREDFPPAPDFVFGASTSASQIEGAAFEDGRTPSIGDIASHAGHSFMSNDTGDIACDSYHKYKGDVQLMVKTGLEAYRFSISWSRLIPNGSGLVNTKGLNYYNNLINDLISNGIQPHVTLVHGDFPQILEEKYGGPRNKKIVEDFVRYADVCFSEFGNRVLHWTTFNEPNILTIGAYDYGFLPPCRCSSPFGLYRDKCTDGDSIHEPFIVGHNLLLAHASATTLYREKYQETQRGFIGLNLYAPWYSPVTNSNEDAMATQRALDYQFGWFMHPLVFGDYPEIMKKNSGSKLPTFTEQESKQVRDSFDFIGLNHYATVYVMDKPNNLTLHNRDMNADMEVDLIDSMIVTANATPKLIATHKPGDTKQIPAVSLSLQRILEYIMKVYQNPPVFVHENGKGMNHYSGLDDMPRVKYLQAYIKSLLHAIRMGSNTRGYFVWSFLDCYELFGGYNKSFGLYFVDFDDERLTRRPRLSARWYSNFLKKTSKHQSH